MEALALNGGGGERKPVDARATLSVVLQPNSFGASSATLGIIAGDSVDRFIDKLADVIGNPSAGKR